MGNDENGISIDQELDLLGDYMGVWSQLAVSVNLRQCGALVCDIPSFSQYKAWNGASAYSMSIPHYRERCLWDGGKVRHSTSVGLGHVDNEIAHRYFNYWQGIRYFTGDNTEGEWAFSQELMKQNGIVDVDIPERAKWRLPDNGELHLSFIAGVDKTPTWFDRRIASTEAWKTPLEDCWCRLFNGLDGWPVQKGEYIVLLDYQLSHYTADRYANKFKR